MLFLLLIPSHFKPKDQVQPFELRWLCDLNTLYVVHVSVWPQESHVDHVPQKSVIPVLETSKLIPVIGCQEEKILVGCLLTKKKSVVTLRVARHISMTHNMHMAATAVEANNFSH